MTKDFQCFYDINLNAKANVMIRTSAADKKSNEKRIPKCDRG